MTDPGQAHAWVGYVVSALLVMIVFLLGLAAWFMKGQYSELKDQNKNFLATTERMWGAISGKVSDSLCLEREGRVYCQIGSLEADFRKHSHTELPDSSKLFVKE